MKTVAIDNTISLKALLENHLVVSDAFDADIKGLSLNTKTLTKGDLFFAFPGEHADGRQFIEEAVEKGAAAILAEAKFGIREISEYTSESGKKVPLLTMENLAFYCGDIASEYYGHPSHHMKVVGITGTNGKTSCSYYLAAAYSRLRRKSGIMGTLGYGVYGEKLVSTGMTTVDPITVQKILAQLYYQGVEIVAMEVSSHALSQGRVIGVKFACGVLTNLTHDHLDYHENMLNYWHAKKRLFKDYDVPYAVINADDPYGKELLQELWGNQYVCGYTINAKAGLSGEMPMVTSHEVKLSRHGINTRIHTPWGIGRLSSPQLGTFNLSNLLAVTTVMVCLGEHLDDALSCMEHLPVVPGRMQTIFTQGKPLVVVDYAHTPDALKNVLTVLKANCQGKLWCMFGCGGERDKEKRSVMTETAEAIADNVIITDDNPRLEDPKAIVDDMLAGAKRPKMIHVEHDRAKAIKYAITHAKSNDTVLLAGKGHETVQIIGRKRMKISDVAIAKTLIGQNS